MRRSILILRVNISMSIKADTKAAVKTALRGEVHRRIKILISEGVNSVTIVCLPEEINNNRGNKNITHKIKIAKESPDKIIKEILLL